MSSVKDVTYCGFPAASLINENRAFVTTTRPSRRNEALFPFVLFTLSLDEFGISFRPGSTFVRVNNLVPFFQVAQFFFGVAQHLLERRRFVKTAWPSMLKKLIPI